MFKMKKNLPVEEKKVEENNNLVEDTFNIS